MPFNTFPSTIPTSPPQASALLSNAAANAGLTNAVPLDRLTNLEQIVANLLVSFPPLGGGVPGGALTGLLVPPKLVTAIPDATATGVMTITVPNVAANALIQVTLVGILGAGGAIGAGECVTSVSYNISVTRTVGVAMGATASTAFGSAAAVVVGATTETCTGALTLNGEGVGVTNTATFKATITKGGGSSTNHTCLVYALILNNLTGGVTIS